MSRAPDVFFGAGYAASGSTNPHWIKQNEFYHSRSDGGDGFGYIGREKAIEKDALSYAGDRPGSTGLWGPNGFYTKDEIKLMREQLRASDCPVWHGVVSFSAEFGEKYAWDTKQAQKLIQEVMPKFLKAQGLALDNVTWTGAYHVNTDNPHVHLLWYENAPLKGTSKNPRYSKGRVPHEAIDTMKFEIEKLCKEDKKLNLSYAIRNDIISTLKKNTQSDSFRATIFKMEYMVKGDMKNYASLSPEDKNTVNCYVDYALGDEGRMELEAYKQQLELEQKHINQYNANNNVKANSTEYKDKRINELYSRCGNVLIKIIKLKQGFDKLNALTNDSKEIKEATKLLASNKADDKPIKHKMKKIRHSSSNALKKTFNSQMNIFRAQFAAFIAGLLTEPYEEEINKNRKKTDKELEEELERASDSGYVLE